MSDKGLQIILYLVLETTMQFTVNSPNLCGPLTEITSNALYMYSETSL